MSHASIYLNRGSVEGGRERVDINVTASPTELMHRRSPLGYAFGAALDTLGIDQIINLPDIDMATIGDVETAHRKVRELRINIGSIASQAAELGAGYYRTWVGNGLDQAAQRLPQALEQDPSLMTVVGNVIAPLGEQTNDDGCTVYVNANRTWHVDSDPREYFRYQPERYDGTHRSAFVNVTRTQYQKMLWLAHRNQTTAGRQFDGAVEQYLAACFADPETAAAYDAAIIEAKAQRNARRTARVAEMETHWEKLTPPPIIDNQTGATAE